MRKFNTIQQITAVVLSVLILIQFSGCRTLTGISRTEIPYSERTNFYIHRSDTSFHITNTYLADGFYSGIVPPLRNPARVI